jgi:hypothetical protein
MRANCADCEPSCEDSPPEIGEEVGDAGDSPVVCKLGGCEDGDADDGDADDGDTDDGDADDGDTDDLPTYDMPRACFDGDTEVGGGIEYAPWGPPVPVAPA